MSSTLFILSFVFALACAQAPGGEFTCNVQEHGAGMVNGGFVRAILKYSWAQKSMLTTYTTSNSNQLWSFNTNGGYAATDPYDAQYKFEFGATCNPSCAVASLEAPQPILFQDSTKLNVGTFNGISGFVPISAASLINFVAFDAAGLPTLVVWKDGKEWSLTGCVTSTFTAANFDSPEGCTCGKPLDIVLVLDRSSSIDDQEFLKEKQFVKDLVAAFTCSPTGVNFGITNFHSYTWDGPVTLLQGNNNPVVATGADALQCAPFAQCIVASDPGSCCGSGTSISSGIVNGADMMATASTTGFRARAGKVMIVLTDGYHNKILKKNAAAADGLDRSQGGKPSGENYYVNNVRCTETASPECVTGLNADIDLAISYALNKVPNMNIFAVGVGDVWNQQQLERIALGKPNNVIGTRDWNLLSGLVDEIVAKTCDQTTTASCPNCCGFCSCGICAPVDGCGETNFCDQSSIVGACCAVTAKTNICPDGADKCKDYFCDRALNDNDGGCNEALRPVPQPLNPCLKTTCDSTTGLFNTEQDLVACPPPPPPPRCVLNTECDDGVACTIDVCVVDPLNDQNNACTNTPKVCSPTTCTTSVCNTQTGECDVTPIPVPPNNMCFTFSCVEGNGIVQAPVNPPCPATPPCLVDGDCNDNNACTNEVCMINAVEPLLNTCVRTNVDVAATCTAGDACNLPRCDPAVGCVYDAVPIPPATMCFVSSCDRVTGVISTMNICPPPPPPPSCVEDKDCDDGNACTTQTCVNPNTTEAKCVFAETTCEDNNPCTIDTCDILLGCQHVNQSADFCNDNNACTADVCDPLSLNLTNPCTHTNITCPPNPDKCHEYVCSVQDGCILLDIVCPKKKNCSVSGCNKTRDGCYVKNAGTCGAPPVALIAGITAGVIAGIVIAAVAGALMVGGGAAYAFTQGAGAGLGASIANNPIYAPAGNSGTNPLNRG